jgi:hypothetical protein
LSHPGCYAARMMKLGIMRMLGQQEWIIASFGQAQLVQKAGGQWELRGGSTSDLTAAKEWISLFHHEAVPAWMPRGGDGFVVSARQPQRSIPIPFP